MNEHIGPVDLLAMGREYIAEADAICEKITSLRQKYRREPSFSLKYRIRELQERQAELRRTGLLLIRRAERRGEQEDFKL